MMLIDKSRFRVNSNKKLLHKIGKQWVTISIAMLAMLGGTALVESVTASADTANNNSEQRAVQTSSASPKAQINQNLNKARQQSISQRHNQSQSNQSSSVQSQATRLHRALIAKASVSGRSAQFGPADNGFNKSSRFSRNSSNNDQFNTNDASHNSNVNRNKQPRLGNNIQAQAMSAPQVKTGASQQTGKYDGLDYSYDPNTSTLKFTGGDLNWNSGVGTSGNWGGQDFIGAGDENPSESYGQDAPTFMNNAKHIVFSGVDASKDLLTGNGRYMFADNNNVESIDLGADWVDSKMSGGQGYTITNIFQSDANLKSVTLPDGFIDSYDNAGGAFSNDNNLQTITIRPLPFDVANSIPGWAPKGTQFAGNDGLPDIKTTNGTMSATDITGPGTYRTVNYVPSNNPQGSDWSNLHEGTANVDINGNDDTITVSNGQLSSSPENGSDEFISDIKTSDGKTIASDVLPNQKKDWKIVFNNVTAPSNNSLAFKFSGGKMSSHNENALGNQVSDIDFNGLNVSDVTNMQGMLINSNDLKHVEFPSSFDTSNVTDMSMMIGSDNALQSVDMSNLSGAKLTDLHDIFDRDASLTSVTLSAKFSPNGNSDVNMGEMFASDANLPFSGINWNGYDTVNAGSMYGMFRNDQNLGDVDLPSTFDTSNVQNFGEDPFSTPHKWGNDGMFQSDGVVKGNPNATHVIDLSHANFDTSNATAMDEMFGDDKNLHQINFGDKFNTSNVRSANLMFGYSDAIKHLTFPTGFDTSNMTNTANMLESDVPDGGLKDITINSSKTKLPNDVWSWGNHDFYKTDVDESTNGTPADLDSGVVGDFTTTANKPVSHIVVIPSITYILHSSKGDHVVAQKQGTPINMQAALDNTVTVPFNEADYSRLGYRFVPQTQFVHVANGINVYHVQYQYVADKAGLMTIHYVDMDNGQKDVKDQTLSYGTGNSDDIEKLCPYINQMSDMGWLAGLNVELAPRSDADIGSVRDPQTHYPALYVLDAPKDYHLISEYNMITLRPSDSGQQPAQMNAQQVEHPLGMYVTFSPMPSRPKVSTSSSADVSTGKASSQSNSSVSPSSHAASSSNQIDFASRTPSISISSSSSSQSEDIASAGFPSRASSNVTGTKRTLFNTDRARIKPKVRRISKHVLYTEYSEPVLRAYQIKIGKKTAYRAIVKSKHGRKIVKGYVVSNRFWQPKHHIRRYASKLLGRALKRVSVYNKHGKRIGHYRKHTAISVKRILRIDRYGRTKLQLTNGLYMTADKRFVKLA